MLRESYVKGKAAELMVSWLIGWLAMRIGTSRAVLDDSSAHLLYFGEFRT